MCFSAAASFITAGTTAAFGIAALARMSHGRQVPLAIMPLFFAVQQGIEGMLWLDLPAAPGDSVPALLTLLYLLLAEVFWPVFVPLAVLLVEPQTRRRRVMLLVLAVGAGVSAYLAWAILSRPHAAAILDGHLVYVSEIRRPDALVLVYAAATVLPLLLSSSRVLVGLGAIVLVGGITAYLAYWQAFASVWCFFAAAASGVILGYFELAHRRTEPSRSGG